MAGELTVTAKLTHVDTGIASPAVSALAVNKSGTGLQAGLQKIGTSEEVINLGECAGKVLGYASIKNRSGANFVEILTGTGGTKFAKLKPGEECLLRFGSDITAPYAIADTAECTIEVQINED